MNTKNSNQGINYTLRKLIQNKSIQSMVLNLYRDRNEKKIIDILLPETLDLFNKIAEDPEHEGYERFSSISSNLKDTLFLKELVKLDAITLTAPTIDEDFYAGVIINNSQFIKELYQWIKEEKLIINYGIFSLHTFIGEAYCIDNRYTFHTNKGLFRVFKNFLERPTHILSYKEIYQLFQGTNLDNLNYGAENIHQIIGDLREKLLMKGELSKLFIPSDDQYLLRSIE